MGLSFDAVSFSYYKTPVLQSVSFQVSSGEIVGYLGVNGAGKTTTFLLATGLLRPHSGQIRIADCDPARSKSWSYKVGVLTSGAGLYPRLSVRRNLSFFAELYGRKVDLDQHLESHGLKEFADKPAGQLSQGFRRRLALARATIHQPELLLLDEPADGLDPQGTEHLHLRLKAFADNGGAVVFTSHRLEEVERLCHRILILSDGVIALEGTPAELTQSSNGKGLRELVLGLQPG
ncbi:MAG: heme ABC exporter ATP-binding protein CcmA [Vulcanimicrobiota bacterium]